MQAFSLIVLFLMATCIATVNYSRKNILLRCSAGFWIRLYITIVKMRNIFFVFFQIVISNFATLLKYPWYLTDIQCNFIYLGVFQHTALEI